MKSKRIFHSIFWSMIHLLMTGFLTVLTQVGGIIYLISIVLFRKFSLLKKTLAGILLYLICVFLIVPFFAKFGNREPLPLTGKIAPYTVFTCLQNRHYVSTKTKTTLESVSKKFSLQYPESRIFYLDANFPFFDGFPLFPHLSHSDGKKLDLAFYYKNDNVPVNKSASFIGYGFYEGPIGKEINYAAICRRKGFWQYGFIGKLIPMRNQELYSVDETRTRRLIQLLNNASGTDKIFLEPHLQTRWKLHALRKIRFHGCHAVRHDDHIHWQIH